MFLFGPKAACPRCGKGVRKPRNPADFLCRHCDGPGPWATPEYVDGWQREQDARREYRLLLGQFSTGAVEPNVPELKEAAALARYTPEELRSLHMQTFLDCVHQALTDDILTKEEDARLRSLLGALALIIHEG